MKKISPQMLEAGSQHIQDLCNVNPETADSIALDVFRSMTTAQTPQEVSELSEAWISGDEFDAAFDDATSYLEHLVEPFEECIRSIQDKLSRYHGTFAAELTGDIVANESLEIYPHPHNDKTVEDLVIRVVHLEGVFNAILEGFPDTQKTLSDLIEDWSQEANPTDRKNLALYLHKLADKIAQN